MDNAGLLSEVVEAEAAAQCGSEKGQVGTGRWGHGPRGRHRPGGGPRTPSRGHRPPGGGTLTCECWLVRSAYRASATSWGQQGDPTALGHRICGSFKKREPGVSG